MDHSLLVLGQAGMLVGGLVVPRFVVDQVQALAAAPDPVTSRRARRGLETLEALREAGVTVKVADNELPEIEDAGERLLETSRRLGLRLLTSSGRLRDAAPGRGVRVTDLRRLVDRPRARPPARASGSPSSWSGRGTSRARRPASWPTATSSWSTTAPT